MASRLCTLDAQLSTVTVVTGGIKPGKDVFIQDEMVADSRNFTYLGQTSSKPLVLALQHQPVVGQNLYAEIDNLVLFRGFYGYLL